MADLFQDAYTKFTVRGSDEAANGRLALAFNTLMDRSQGSTRDFQLQSFKRVDSILKTIGFDMIPYQARASRFFDEADALRLKGNEGGALDAEAKALTAYSVGIETAIKSLTAAGRSTDVAKLRAELDLTKKSSGESSQAGEAVVAELVAAELALAERPRFAAEVFEAATDKSRTRDVDPVFSTAFGTSPQAAGKLLSATILAEAMKGDKHLSLNGVTLKSASGSDIVLDGQMVAHAAFIDGYKDPKKIIGVKFGPGEGVDLNFSADELKSLLAQVRNGKYGKAEDITFKMDGRIYTWPESMAAYAAFATAGARAKIHKDSPQKPDAPTLDVLLTPVLGKQALTEPSR